MAKPPSKRSSATEINRFLQQTKSITEFVANQPRLLFAIDATASRQPTWDTACHLQQEMFQASGKIASLSVQLCYFRGFHDFSASPWLNNSAELSRKMSAVRCEGGHTQIARLLKHAQTEHQKVAIKAVVFIGDAIEESPDSLCNLAGQCGLLKLPLFMFQEGRNKRVTNTFKDMARLSGGAFAHFDQNSARRLADLLGAVASYAAGGRQALENNNSEMAKALLKQLP
ncbi:MAG: VWA domain-containing protein [Halioglobus sp.]